MSDTATKRWIEQVIAALRDTADRIERGKIAPSRFNIRAPVLLTGIDNNGHALYKIGDKRSIFIETVDVPPAQIEED